MNDSVPARQSIRGCGFAHQVPAHGLQVTERGACTVGVSGEHRYVVAALLQRADQPRADQSGGARYGQAQAAQRPSPAGGVTAVNTPVSPCA